MEVARGVVEEVARHVVDDAQASLVDWSVEAVGGGVMGEVGEGGIRRITGTVGRRSGVAAWSVIVKELTPDEIPIGELRMKRADPKGSEYWRREADAYSSGLLDDLSDGLVAPRCYRIDEGDVGILLWLEDLPDESPATWPMARFGQAARHLGRFDGRHRGEALTDGHPWLSRGRIHDWLRFTELALPSMPTGRREGLVATRLSDESVARMERLWNERHRLLAALEALPVTLCHHDAHRRNLMSNRRAGVGADASVAIDWQYLGTGHLGEEIAALIGVSLQFLDAPMGQVHELEGAVLDGYRAGLREAGWDVDEQSVRLGYVVAACLLMGLGCAGTWFLGLTDKATEAMTERIIGRPVAEIALQWSRLQPYLLDLGDEALSLVR